MSTLGHDDVVEVPAADVKKNDKTWPKGNLLYFLDLMEGEVKKNNRPTTTFTTSSWTYIRTQLNGKFKSDYSQVQLKNKFNKLRQTYKDYTALINNTGVTHDPTTGLVFAEDEFWTRIVKVNKSASNFKKNGCPYYPQLCTIFGDTTATGKHAHPSTKMPSDSENSNNEVEEIEVTKANDKEAEVEKEVAEKRNTTTSRVRRRGENYNSALSNLVMSFNENNKRRTDLLELKLKHDGISPATTIGSNSAASIDAAREMRRKCLKVVEEMEDIDGKTYAKAFKMIQENLVWCETFLDVADIRKRDVITNL